MYPQDATDDQPYSYTEARFDDLHMALGSCCACGQVKPGMRTIVMLDRRAPVSGFGWGCAVCGLAPDGAVAVVCDGCYDAQAPLRAVCARGPGEDLRVLLADLPDTRFQHDLTKHPEIAAASGFGGDL